MSRRPASIAVAASLALGACGGGAPLGRVVLAVADDACADFCVADLRAEIFREHDDAFPIGPAAEAPCGTAVGFDDLPAGHRVYVTVTAYDITGAVVLHGTSAVVTVVADGEAPVEVDLAPAVTPAITAVSPDPAPAAGGAVTLTGSGFGDPAGAAGVTLDGAALATSGWSDGQVVATLPGASREGTLGLERCGVHAAPWPLRVVSVALGVAPVMQPPGCAGRAVAGLAAEGEGGLVVAFRCADPGSSYVQRFGVGATCPLTPGAAWTLPDAPSALAVAAGVAWVGLAGGGLAAIDLTGTALSTATGIGQVTGLAANASRVVAIVDGRLAAVTLAGATAIDEDPTPTAVGIAGDAVVAAAAAADGAGRLVIVPATQAVSTLSIPDCTEPVAVAGTDHLMLVACADRVAVYDRDAGAWLGAVTGLAARALAWDPRGDVALAWAPGDAVVAFDARAVSALARWDDPGLQAPGVPALAALGAIGPHAATTFAASAGPGPDGLDAWTPYARAGPCL